MVFSSAAEKIACPILLAGTCRQYSKKAMPHEMRMTATSAVDLNFRWPYQVKAMKMLEAMSRPRSRPLWAWKLSGFAFAGVWKA
jgi:hypothetical protein